MQVATYIYSYSYPPAGTCDLIMTGHAVHELRRSGDQEKLLNADVRRCSYIITARHTSRINIVD